jgi:putative transcriptional regulator
MMDARRASGRSLRLAAVMGVCAVLAFVLIAAGKARGDDAKPYFLIATSDLSDPIFARSVILMLPSAPSPDAIVAGLIINKPTTIPLRRLFPKASALTDETAYFGGPVGLNEASMLLHTPAPAGKATRLLDDIYLSTDRASIAGAIDGGQSIKDLRLLLGRAQWTRDQLHHEIMEGAWYIAPAEADMVFSPNPEGLWRALVKRAQLLKVEAVAPGEPHAFSLLWAPRQPPY